MKIRSSSSAKKRFRITGKGKLMSMKSSKNHLLMNKSKRQKNLFNKGKPVDKTMVRRVQGMLPYLR